MGCLKTTTRAKQKNTLKKEAGRKASYTQEQTTHGGICYQNEYQLVCSALDSEGNAGAGPCRVLHA